MQEQLIFWSRLVLLALICAAGGIGCGKGKSARQEALLESESPAEQKAEPESLAGPIAGAEEALKKGEFDDAAARLLAIRSAGREFSAKDSAAYRRALNDAYSKALEAAANGDQRAQAAIQMIRAANAH